MNNTNCRYILIGDNAQRKQTLIEVEQICKSFLVSYYFTRNNTLRKATVREFPQFAYNVSSLDS